MNAMNFAVARANMIESQVRPNGVTDDRVIVAMAEVPRERFVPGDRRSVAYMDGDIVIRPKSASSPARCLMEPMTFARLLQLASLASRPIGFWMSAAAPAIRRWFLRNCLLSSPRSNAIRT